MCIADLWDSVWTTSQTITYLLCCFVWNPLIQGETDQWVNPEWEFWSVALIPLKVPAYRKVHDFANSNCDGGAQDLMTNRLRSQSSLCSPFLHRQGEKTEGTLLYRKFDVRSLISLMLVMLAHNCIQQPTQSFFRLLRCMPCDNCLCAISACARHWALCLLWVLLLWNDSVFA